MLPAVMIEHIEAQTRLVQAQAMHEMAAAYFFYAMTISMVIATAFGCGWSVWYWARSESKS